MSAPLVLLHGFTGAPESWDEVVACLGCDASPVRETLCGHGAPDIDRADDFIGEVERIASRLRARGGERAHLVGYSLGARVVLGLLSRHPDLVGRATLVAVHPGLFDAGERTERTRADAAWADLLEREGTAAFIAAWEQQPLFATQSALDDGRLAVQRAIRARHRPDGLARSLRVLGLGRMPEWRGALSRVNVAVRIVVGEADAKFRAIADSMLPLLPRGTLHIVEGAGHNVLLEQPRALAAAIRETEETRP